MDFKPDDFERFLEASVGHLSHLTRTCTTSDMVLKLLDIFAHLVTEMKQKVCVTLSFSLPFFSYLASR